MENIAASVDDLCDAARAGDTVRLSELLRRGADVNGVTGDMWMRLTPAHQAALWGKTGALQLLIDAGADVSLTDTLGWAPTHVAAGAGETGALQLLIDAGADVNLTNRFGETPAHKAARAGETGALQLLITAGADINVTSTSGRTPAHWAARQGHTGALQLLITAGADVNVADTSGETPAHKAARQGHTGALQLLITAGADVNVANTSGDTALMGAAGSWGEDNTDTNTAVQILLAAGADIHHRNKLGESAEMSAVAGGNTNIAEYLKIYTELVSNTAVAQIQPPIVASPRQSSRVPIPSFVAEYADTTNAKPKNQHSKSSQSLFQSENSAQLIKSTARQSLQDQPLSTQFATSGLHYRLPSSISSSIMDETQVKTTELKESQIQFVTPETLISTYSDTVPQHGQPYNNDPTYSPHSTIRSDTASTNHGNDKTKQPRNVALSSAVSYSTTTSQGTISMSENTTSETVVRDDALAKKSDSSIRPTTSEDIDEQQNNEPDDDYYSAPTPMFLPMSPGGLDEIMAQSPATWEIASDILEEDEFTDVTSFTEDTKPNSPMFAVPAPLPPKTSSKNPNMEASSLFEMDPPLFETIQPTKNHSQNSTPLTATSDLQKDSRIKESSKTTSDEEKNKDDVIRSLREELMKKNEIIEEKDSNLKEKEETITKKDGKLKSKGKKLKGKDEKLNSKGDKIKQQSEKIEESEKELENANRKLKGKGKRMYECEEMLEEQGKLVKDKDKHLALKEERIVQMEKYQEEQAKKIKIGRVDKVNNSLKQSLYSTKADYKLTQQQSVFVLDQILPSICRIDMPGISGTGFVVGGVYDSNPGHMHRYMLTCYHVRVQDALRDKKSCVASFGSSQFPILVNVLAPAMFGNKDMDYVLVKLEPSQELEQFLNGKVALGQLVTVDDPIHNDGLVLCAHTDKHEIDWGARAVCIDDAEVISTYGDLSNINRWRQHSVPHHYPLTHNFMYYDCSCREGTSGAPCLSARQEKLYAMHCGAVFKERVGMEYGILLKCVVDDISSQIRAGNMQQERIWLDHLSELFPLLSTVIFPDTAMQ